MNIHYCIDKCGEGWGKGGEEWKRVLEGGEGWEGQGMVRKDGGG